LVLHRERESLEIKKPTTCFFSSFVVDFCNFCPFLVLHRERERERERERV
jgi:ATP adenylyltransferase/5',5'''-P-1,P-4-tetraphosphate phosphorylase II